MVRIITLVCGLSFALCYSACTQVQHDSGRALSNANSVVTSTAPKVWTAPAKTTAETDEKREKTSKAK